MLFSDRLNTSECEVIVEHFNHVHVAPDWNFSDRVMKQHLLYFIKGGKMLVDWKQGDSEEHPERDHRHVLHGGDLLWINPGVLHSFSLIAGEQRPTKFNIRFDLKDRFGALHLDDGHLIAKQCHHLSSLFDYFLVECREQKPPRSNVCKHLLSLIHTEAESSMKKSVQSARVKNRDHTLTPLQKQHCYHFLASMNHQLTIQQLSAELQYSTDYFSRIFKPSFGISPKSWLIREKVLRSSEALINEGLSISGVIERYGYSDQASFSKQFKSVMGVSPKEWRKQHRAYPS